MPETPDHDETRTGPSQGWLADVHLAAAFFTRLVPPPGGAAGRRPLARAARGFPLVGFALGLGGAAVYAIASGLGLTPMLAALCAVAALIAATGARHEDGLAKVADGFGSGSDREAKLAIMRDGRIDSLGVIAVTVSLLARTAALASLAEPAVAAAALVAAATASRAALPAMMRSLPAARADGLAASVPTRDSAVLAAGIAVAVALVGLGLGGGLLALAGGALAATGVAVLARRQIGGFTGDVLGAAQQAAETAVLLVAAAVS